MSDTFPFVFCICPTYARYPARGWLVEEAVESFLQQTYPADRRLLVICNDCPAQTLVCDAPGVAVVNMPERLPDLGSKYNSAINFCHGTPRGAEVPDFLICPFEDDDLSLPHRISLSVDRLGSADYFNPKAYVYWPVGSEPIFERLTGYAHNASIFRLSAWRRVGGYPPHCRQDAAMDGLLRSPRSRLKVVDGPLSPADTGYVYRWGVSDHHVSAYGDVEEAYRRHGERPVTPGTFVVRPHWREDYAARFAALAKEVSA